MIYRVLGFMVVLLAILFLPYWIYIPSLFVAIILFPFFWEGILLAFLINIIYDSGTTVFSLLVSPLALSALLVLIIFLPIRESLRPYV